MTQALLGRLFFSTRPGCRPFDNRAVRSELLGPSVSLGRTALPNFVLTREYRVPGKSKVLEETMQSRNRQTINMIYDRWWSDPNTMRIQLVQRMMDSTELIREGSR